MDRNRSPEARQRLQHYATNPPEGSDLRKAIEFGVDPTMTFRNMFALTPEERLRNAGRVIRSTAQMLGTARGRSGGR